MKTALIIGLLLIVTASLIIAGCSRARHGHRFGSPDKAVNRIAKKLGLNDDQKQELNILKDEIVSKKGELGPNRSAIMDEIKAQFQSDEVDEDRLKAVIDTEKAKLDALAVFAVAKISDFHKILTPQQRATVVEKMDKWKKCGRWGKHCDNGKKS